MRTGLAMIAAAALTACATAEKAPVVPSFELASGEAAPQARLYANCIAEAAAMQSYDREGALIRFHCSGPAAQAFFDALGAYAANAGSEYVSDERTWRFTQKMEANPYGLDFCRRDNGVSATVDCTIILNAGPFVTTQP